MRKSEDVHRELYAARDDARQMSIALRSAADALDELGPAPEHVPAQDEVKRTLTRLSDARARVLNRRQTQLIDARLSQAARLRGAATP